jgi:hypothetical protein
MKFTKWIKNNATWLFIIVISVSFFADSIRRYNEKTKTHYQIELPNGRVYWSKSVEEFPNGVRFKNSENDMEITLYSKYTITPPSN